MFIRIFFSIGEDHRIDAVQDGGFVEFFHHLREELHTVPVQDAHPAAEQFRPEGFPVDAEMLVQAIDGDLHRGGIHHIVNEDDAVGGVFFQQAHPVPENHDLGDVREDGLPAEIAETLRQMALVGDIDVFSAPVPDTVGGEIHRLVPQGAAGCVKHFFHIVRMDQTDVLAVVQSLQFTVGVAEHIQESF